MENCLKWCFYGMLFYQGDEAQTICKKKLLKDIAELLVYWKGPYFLGDKISLSDIAMTPFFERMCVLKYYRKFEVPQGHKVFIKWYKWKRKMLNH